MKYIVQYLDDGDVVEEEVNVVVFSRSGVVAGFAGKVINIDHKDFLRICLVASANFGLK